MDCDGSVVKRDKYFSLRLLDLGIPIKKAQVDEFFQNEFLLCETGRADLKQELPLRIKDWGWNKTLEELLDFWFSGETLTDPDMMENLQQMRRQGVKCFLTTDQEKYRMAYLWDTVGLKHNFDGKFSSCEVGYLKRQPEYWEKACLGLPGCKKDEIVVWDDDLKCLAAAQSVGLRAEAYKTFRDYKIVMGRLIEA